jgi:hypothetical protein
VRVTTGTSHVLASIGNQQTVIVWLSPTAGNKTEQIPAASAAGGDIVAVKMQPAVMGTLTITAASGTIGTLPSASIVGGESITLWGDATENDWLVI